MRYAYNLFLHLRRTNKTNIFQKRISESVKFLSQWKGFMILPPPLSHTKRTFSLPINSHHVAAHHVFDHSSIIWYFVQLAFKTTLYIEGNFTEHPIMTNQIRRGSETKAPWTWRRMQSFIRDILGKAVKGNSLLSQHYPPQQSTQIRCFAPSNTWEI